MKPHRLFRRRAWPLVAAMLTAGLPADAQQSSTSTNQNDVLAAARASTELRVIVSLAARRLWVVTDSADTLLKAPVAVGSGRVMSAGGRTWRFNTPRGVRTVLSKDVKPLWIRPDWAFVEIARKEHLRVDSVSARRPRPLSDGRELVVRGNVVGIESTAQGFVPAERNAELIYDGVLYIPPIGTAQRGVAGTLGDYRLNLGDAIGLHGTPEKASIGQAVTHGCMRLADAPLAWLYENIPLGTKVYIY